MMQGGWEVYARTGVGRVVERVFESCSQRGWSGGGAGECGLAV